MLLFRRLKCLVIYEKAFIKVCQCCKALQEVGGGGKMYQ